METKNCPYCGEKILLEAKKCKHCKEFINVSTHENSNYSEQETIIQGKFDLSNIILGLLIIGLGWGLYFFGSWHVLVGRSISIFEQALITGSKLSFVNKDFIFVKDGFLFRINESYYGFFCDKHFFDAPFIQWAMLFAGVYSICSGIKMFITGLYSYVK